MLLVVAATMAEAATAGARPSVVCGLGPAAAAAGTMQALAAGGYTAVLNVGIAGGFAANGVAPGQVVVADPIMHADLGVRTDQGWLALPDAPTRTDVPGAAALAAAVGGRAGPLLTLSAMTGTEQDAADLLARYPAALAEAMEGAGVAAAAARAGVPVYEVRAVSNAVGRRDRGAWDVAGALAALGRALPAAIDLLERP